MNKLVAKIYAQKYAQNAKHIAQKASSIYRLQTKRHRNSSNYKKKYRNVNRAKRSPIFGITYAVVYIIRAITLPIRLMSKPNWLVAIATIVYTIVATGQWLTMKATLDAANSSSDQTRDMVEAAKQQASAAAAMAEVAKSNLISSERAWVGPNNASIENWTDADKPLRVNVTYQNTGREPATQFSKSLILTYFEKDDIENGNLTIRARQIFDDCNRIVLSTAGDVAFPSTGFNTYNFFNTASDEDSKALRADLNSVLIIQGCFVYKTVESVHRTNFCFYFKPSKSIPDRLNICEGGSTAN